MRDEFLIQVPIDEPLKNTTTYCKNKGFEFTFPLRREGYRESEVDYTLDFCAHLYTEQILPVGDVNRRTYGAILPTFYNLRARYTGSGPELYNATAFQVEAYMNFKHPGLKVYALEYERVKQPDFEFDHSVTFHAKAISELNLGQDWTLRHSSDWLGRSRVDYLGPVIEAEENEYYMPPDTNQQIWGDYTAKTQHFYEEHWPKERLPFLTFSTYLFGDLEGLDSRQVLVVNREQFQHSDLFSDPVAFNSLAGQCGYLIERDQPDIFGDFNVVNVRMQGEEDFYYPECEQGYTAVSAFRNPDGENRKAEFAAYRENIIHCIKDSATIRMKDKYESAFHFSFKGSVCEPKREITWDSFFTILADEDGITNGYHKDNTSSY